MSRRKLRESLALLALALPLLGGPGRGAWATTFEASGQFQADRSAVFVGSTTWDGLQNPGLSQANQGVIYFDTSTYHFEVSENGGAYFTLQSGQILIDTQTFSGLDTFASSVAFNGSGANVFSLVTSSGIDMTAGELLVGSGAAVSTLTPTGIQTQSLTLTGSLTLPAGYILPAAVLPSTVAYVTSTQTFSGLDTFASSAAFDGSGANVFSIATSSGITMGSGYLDVNGTAGFGVGAAVSTFTSTGNLQLIAGSTITTDTGSLAISTSATASAAAAPSIYLSAAGNVGLGTSAPANKLSVFNGTLQITTAAAASSGLVVSSESVTTSATQLIMEQTGDVYGPTSLSLQNRNGSNGALYQNTGIDLVDFGFQPELGPQSDLRYEHRDTAGDIQNLANTTGELQWLDSSTTTVPGPKYLMMVGREAFMVMSSSAGFGTTSPTATLDVQGSFLVSTATAPSLQVSSAALHNVQIGYNGAAFTSMGTCSFSANLSDTATTTVTTCTGVPGNTSTIINCSATAAFTTAGTGVYCYANGTPDDIVCNTVSHTSGGNMTYNCLWVEP